MAASGSLLELELVRTDDIDQAPRAATETIVESQQWAADDASEGDDIASDHSKGGATRSSFWRRLTPSAVRQA